MDDGDAYASCAIGWNEECVTGRVIYKGHNTGS
jgi:hypothetical protein